MKWVYKFSINNKKEVEVTKTSTGEKGEEITTKKKENKVVPIQFALRKPNRRMYDDAELFYGVKLSEGIKAGLLTKTQLAKRYDNDGGPFSSGQKKQYSVLLLNVFERESDVQKIQLNLGNLSEKEKREKLTSSLIELTELREEMREFEVFHSSIFDQTAEGRAKNTSIMWWVLFSSYWKEEEDSEFSPVFDGKTFDTKIDSYDEIEDKEDAFWNEVISKLAYFVGFWYGGRATNQEEFEEIERLYDASVFKEDEKEAPEETPEEAAETPEGPKEDPKEKEPTEENDKTEES